MSIEIVILMAALGCAGVALITQASEPAYGACFLAAVALMLLPGLAPWRLAMASFAAAIAALVLCLAPRDVPRFATTFLVTAATALCVAARGPALAGNVDPLILGLCAGGVVALSFGRLGLVVGPIALSLLPFDALFAWLCIGLGLIAAELFSSAKEVSS